MTQLDLSETLSWASKDDQPLDVEALRPPLCSQATATQSLFPGRVQPIAKLQDRYGYGMIEVGSPTHTLDVSFTLKRIQIISLRFLGKKK